MTTSTNPIDRSIALKQRGDLAGALAELDGAIRDGVDPPRAHYQRGLTLVALRRTDDAIAAYAKAIELRPDYVKALVNLAGLYMEQQNADLAGRLLKRAEPLVGPDDPVFLCNRAMHRRMINEGGAAIRDAQRATEIAPGEAGTWAELARSLLMDPSRARDAANAARNALEIDPNHARASHDLAVALDRSGDPTGALDHAKRALTSEPDDLTYQQTTACVLLHLDRAPEAMPFLESVERGRPNDFEAQYNLACGLAKTGQVDRAIPHVERAIGLVPPRHRAAFLAHVPNDADLAALQTHPGFRRLLKS